MIVVDSKNLWKSYKIYEKPIDRLKEALNPFPKKFYRDFHALKNVSFTIKQGESVGFVGVNGSGKSTLLQLISGVMTPSQGTIKTSGRVAALLELGAGFNPELTGLENIHFQCSLMGIDGSQRESLIHSIREFAQIGDFISQPVRTYSSGMYVRLAFASAINVNPDILIVDEALAVGDIQFQNKCLRKIREFREQGKTMLFVSHDAGAIKTLCDRAILLNKGELLLDDNPDQVMRYYNNMLAIMDESELKTDLAKRSGTKKVTIERVTMNNSHGMRTDTFVVGEKTRIEVEILAHAEVGSPTVGFSIHDRLGNEVFGINSFILKQDIGQLSAGNRKRVAFDLNLELGVATFSLSVSCHASDSHLVENYEWLNDACIFRVVPNPSHHFTGLCRLETSAVVSSAP